MDDHVERIEGIVKQGNYCLDQRHPQIHPLWPHYTSFFNLHYPKLNIEALHNSIRYSNGEGKGTIDFAKNKTMRIFSLKAEAFGAEVDSQRPSKFKNLVT